MKQRKAANLPTGDVGTRKKMLEKMTQTIIRMAPD